MFEVIGLSLGRLSADAVPAGKPVKLGGRGTILAYDMPGPRGAPTLLLLHGLGASGLLNWFPAFGPLSERFRVVAMDLRGHGRGLRAGSRYRLTDCADDAVALMDALEIERCIPVGYSLGGPVAQLMWRRPPGSRRRPRALRDEPQLPRQAARTVGILEPLGRVDRASRCRRAAVAAPLIARRDPTARARSARRRAAATVGVSRDAPLRSRRDDRRGVRARAVHVARVGRKHRCPRLGRRHAPRSTRLPSRQRKLAQAIPGATIHPADTDHAACVLGARAFVPALVEACGSVADRLDGARRVA